MSKMDEKMLAAAMEGWHEDQQLLLAKLKEKAARYTAQAEEVEAEVAKAKAGEVPEFVARRFKGIAGENTIIGVPTGNAGLEGK